MNFRRSLLLICIFMCMILTLLPVSADDMNAVNMTDEIFETAASSTEGIDNCAEVDLLGHEDGSDICGDGAVYFDASAARDGDGSRTSPYKYIKSGRLNYATAYFADGVYELTEPVFVYSSESSKTTLIGQSTQNTIFKSMMENRFNFIVNPDSYFLLMDLTFDNVHINNQANIVAQSVIFKNTKSFDHDNRPGLYNSYEYGVYNSTCGSVIICDTPDGKNTSLTFNDCYFYDNDAYAGGAIAAYKSIVYVMNSYFDGSYADRYGGAIYSRNSYLSIINSSFADSYAKYGGAIYCEDTTLNVFNTLFYDSQSYSFGGVVSSNRGISYYHSCRFEDYGSLTDAGGAIYDVNGTLDIYYSSFTNGYSDYGGALCNLRTNLTLGFSEFTNNKARYYGGSIFNMYGIINIQKNNFSNSRAEGSGGSIFNRLSDSLTLYNNIFLNSSANYGHIIFVDGDEGSVSQKNNVYRNIYNLVCVYRAFVNGAEQTLKSNYITFSVSNDGNYITPLINQNTNPTSSSTYASFTIYSDGSASSPVYSQITKNNRITYDIEKYTFTISDKDIEAYLIDQSGGIFYCGALTLTGNRNYAKQTLFDLNFEEIMLSFQYGNLYDIDGYSSVPIFNYTPEFSTQLPSSYDSRDYGYITPVKDQGLGGNCWAFSGIAALEASIKKATGIEYDFSEENAKNLMSAYSLFGTTSESNDGGNRNMFIAYLTNWFGPVHESSDPYDEFSSLSVIYDPLIHVHNVYYLPERQNANDNNVIKKAIRDYGAVSISLPWFEGYHAITLVGWDDEYTGLDVFDRKSTGAWIFKNSYGSEWHYGGYDYLSYDYYFDRPYTFMFSEDNAYSDIYQYDYAGMTSYYYSTYDNVYYKNQFTSSGNDILSAFSTIFLNNTYYTASVYINGQKVHTQEGYSLSGYHTVPLTREFALSQGDKFIIEIKINNEGTKYVPVSDAARGNRLTYTGGVSFINTGTGWRDLYSSGDIACIRAFTRPAALTEISVSINQIGDVNVGDRTTVVVNVPEYYVSEGLRHYLDGIITFTVNGKYYYSEIKNGKATLDLTFDREGDWRITAQYRSNLEISNIAVNAFKVTAKAQDVIEISSSNVNKYYGGLEQYVATVTKNGQPVANANVQISLNSKTQTVKTDSNGRAVLDLNLPAGTYHITATYADKSVTSKAVIKSTLSGFSEFSGKYLDSYIYATVLDSNGNAVKNSQVTFKVGSQSFKATTDSNGYASAKINLEVGNYTVTVTNPVTGEQKQTTLLVSRADSEIVLSISSSSNAAIITAIVSPVSATGKVYFILDSTVYERDVENGEAVLSLQLSSRDYNVTATYSGDDNYAGSSAYNEFTVANMGYSLWTWDFTGHVGFAGTYIYLTDENFNGISGEIITVTVNGGTYFIITDNDGYGELALTDLPAGVYKVIYQYRSETKVNYIEINSTIDIEDSSTQYSKSNVGAYFYNPEKDSCSDIAVKFIVNGKAYTSTTNANGYANVNVDVPVGTYIVTAVNLISGEEKAAKLIVYKADPTISLTKTQAGTNVTLTATLTPSSATGNVVFTVGNKKYTSAVKNGKATITLDNLDAGSYEAVANYAGDSNLNNVISSSVKFTVEKSVIEISAPDLSILYGSSKKFTVRVTDNGNPLSGAGVTVSIGNDVILLLTDSNGVASMAVNLAPGSYVFTSYCLGKSITSNVNVFTSVILSDETYDYANSKVTATLYDSSGYPLKDTSLNIMVGSVTYQAKTDSNGIATISVKQLPSTYTVKVTNPATGEVKSSKLTITKSTPQMLVSLTEKGTDYIVEVTLNPSDATGNVVFTFEGKIYTSSVKNGKSSLTLRNYQPGTYSVDASYGGDSYYNAVSLSTNVVFSSKIPVLSATNLKIDYGSSKYFIVIAKDSDGIPLNGVAIDCRFNGARYFYTAEILTTGSDGRAQYSVSAMIPGTYTVVVSSEGAKTYTTKLVVNKAAVKMTASKKTYKLSVKTKKFTVTLKNSKNKVMKNQKITLKVNGKTYSAKTNSKGQATIKITKLKKKGTFTATVKYGGNSYYKSITKKVKITVKK